MKQYICLFLLFISSITAWAQDPTKLPEKPNPPRLVNDIAGMMNAGEVNALEQKLRRLNDSTSTQIAIVIIRTYGDFDRAQYAYELAEKWGVGQAGKNNGVLITVAVDDRKYFTATGYGAEGALPDGIIKRIEEQAFPPNFRAKNYYQGLDEATTLMAQAIAGEYTADGTSTPNGEQSIGIWGWVIGIVVVVFIIRLFFRRGGGRGGRGGGFFGGGMVPPFIIFGSGGSYGGGGGGFGGGGGSDFGGFGGGSFGGGGAGGDW